MNYIEFDLHNRQYTFILRSEQTTEVEYIRIGNKNVDFIKEELEHKRQGFKLNLQKKFPTGVSFEVTLLNKAEEEISYQITEQGILPLFGRMPGFLLLENQRMYIKLLFLNDILAEFNELPMIFNLNPVVESNDAYTKVTLKDITLDSWGDILAVAIQKESRIKQIIPVYLTDKELLISNEYITGLFEVGLMYLKGEHIFRVSFSKHDNEYVPLIEQTQKVLKNNHSNIRINSVRNESVRLQLNSPEPIDKVMLFSDNNYIQADYNIEQYEVNLDAAALKNMKKLYFLIVKGNQYYYEDLAEILKEAGYSLGYIDNTLYNFNLGHIRNSEALSVFNILIEGTRLSFELKEKDVSCIPNETPFLLVKLRKGKSIKYIKGERFNQKFIFDFTAFLEEIEDTNAARWDFYLINDYKSQQSYHLGEFEDTILEKPKRYFKLFKQGFLNNSTFKHYSRIYITVNNELAMVKNTISNLVKEEFKLKIRVTHFYMRKNIIEMEISINSPYTELYRLGSFYLIHRNKDQIDKRKFEMQTISKANGKTVVKVRIDLSELEFSPLYWDPYIGVISDEKEYYVRINAINKSIAWNINETITRYQYDMEEKNIFYPYITLGNNISFTYREKEYFENRYYLFKENLAYLIVKAFPKYFEKRRIWLAFEKIAMSAHDSGYYFFDYMYKNKKHDEFYYIIRKDSPELKNLEDKKNKVVYFMTFRYFIYMFAAELLFSSDTKRNGYNLKLRKSKLAKTLTNKKLVYLQHGVNGLKKVRDFHKDREIFDLVIAPSEFEKQMIINDWGFDESEVEATGLARWDGLRDKTNEIDYKQIFFMPTWRTWMDGMDRDKFKESEYFIKYNEFLSSEKLHKMLEENDIKLKFFIHPKFRDYVDLFEISSPNIEKFGFLEAPIDEMIMKSSLMISDYSSVIWEMFYLEKPCVFFQFDKDKYLEYEGAYMDLDNDLFGDVAYDTDNLLEVIKYYIENDFEEKQNFAELRKEYFTFRDNHNSERIYQAVEDNEDWLVEPLKLPRFKLSHLIPFGFRRKLLDLKKKILS